MRISLETAKMKNAWAAIVGWNSEGKPIHIECFPLHMLQKRALALINIPVVEIIAITGETVNAQGDITLAEHNAGNAAIVWQMANFAGRLNLLKVDDKKKTRPRSLQCIETGEIWPSINQCATVLRISAANLSRHLSGKKGFNTVGGKTFKWK